MKRLLFAVLLALPTLKAQIVTADNCVHQAGDNPDWARPDFDDHQWSKDFPAIGSPYVWTRCRLDLKSLPRTGPIHLGIDTLAAWEVFVNGEPAGSFGNIRTGFASMESKQHRPISWTLANQETISVALRQLPGRAKLRPRPASVYAGNKDSLIALFTSQFSARLRQISPSLLGGAFSLAIGIVLLLLFAFSADRSQPELLWFGLYSLAYGGLRVLDASENFDYPSWLASTLSDFLNAGVQVVVVRVFFAMAGRPFPVFYFVLSSVIAFFHIILWAVRLFAPLEAAQRVADFGLDPLNALILVLWSTAPVLAFWPLWRVPHERRLSRNFCLIWAAGFLARIVPQFSFFQEFGWLEAGTNIRAITVIIVLIGMFVEIARRHRQVSLDRAELQGEMKAAQEVQRLLTSSTLDVAPWAMVEVAYLPAKEVGGDFYFCRQTQEGQLIVVGDVSGKGLRAAMLASVALGALRYSKTNSPGPLLQGLNAALHGQTGGGFVTCCAALLQEDGRMTVAHAGHPSPYVDGREVAVEAGLPLGIVADATYEESAIEGTRITLVSDGVVEAENAQRELFGFERTREISAKSAKEIAEAAKAWDQNDDITVVTVRRNS